MVDIYGKPHYGYKRSPSGKWLGASGKPVDYPNPEEKGYTWRYVTEDETRSAIAAEEKQRQLRKR